MPAITASSFAESSENADAEPDASWCNLHYCKEIRDGKSSYVYPNQEEHCVDWVGEMSKYDVAPRNMLCYYRTACGDHARLPLSDERSVLENDYITQQFLYKNSHLSLDVVSINTISNDFMMSSWSIPPTWYTYSLLKYGSDHVYVDRPPDWKSYPKLGIVFDICGNITRYSYSQAGGDAILAEYPRDDRVHERVIQFERERYALATEIMGKHPPPAVQTGEFGLPPYEVNCNKDRELFKRDNITICISLETYHRMQERGIEIEPVTPSDIIKTRVCEKPGLIPVLNPDDMTFVCARQATQRS